MKWPIVPVELIKSETRNALVGGPFGSDLSTKHYVDEGVPVIRGCNLPDHCAFHDDDFVYVSDDKARVLASNTAGAGDLIFTQRGTLGQVGLIPQNPRYPRYVISQSQMKLTVDDTKVSPKFVYYFFRLPETVEAIKSHVSSSGVPHINLGVLRRFKIPLPPKNVQHRIASIISAYDDLIENNRRRMVLLEEAARQLYREWFVRLRFPGHERVKIKAGVPEGWEKKTLGEVAPDYRDAANPSELEPGTPYIGLEHMPRRSITLTEWGSADQVTSTKLRYTAGDILFGKIRPYFHKVGFSLTDGVTSSDAIVLRPASAQLHAFVLLTVSSDWFVAVVSKTAKEGSKMPRADWNLMEAHEIAVPPASLLDAFRDTIDPLISQLKTLAFQSQKLRAARDLLLPKLMNGEIEPHAVVA